MSAPSQHFFELAIVELRSHCRQPFARDAIGPPVFAHDEAPPSQALENRKRAVIQPPTVAVEAVDFNDVADVVLTMMNSAALRERVQRPLLVLRNVHLEIA